MGGGYVPFKHYLFLRIKAFLTVCLINKGNPLYLSLAHLFQVFSKSRHLISNNEERPFHCTIAFERTLHNVDALKKQNKVHQWNVG